MVSSTVHLPEDFITPHTRSSAHGRYANCLFLPSAGGLDGSMSTLVPVRDAVFKRLQNVQTLMSRHVLQFGGLNSRGHRFVLSSPILASFLASSSSLHVILTLLPLHRIVKNDTVSRALQRGILDGDVLASFEYLPIDLQTDLAAAANTDPDTVRANIRSLRGWE
jgi:cleavage and polyadenylation specificity factor subunit 1